MRSYVQVHRTIYILSAFCFSFPAKSQTADSSVLWKVNQINVCWINPSDENSKEREWVQRAIDKTWQASSQLSFVGWEKCNAFKKNGENGIRILIADTHPEVKTIGRAISYDSVGMVLNFTFSEGVHLPVKTNRYKRVSDYTDQTVVDVKRIVPDKENKRLFIEATAVHEFGHALGFSHEQNNCNYGPDCMFPEKTSDKKTILSATCNERSVMNYCNDVYLNEGYLSIMDIQLLQRFYGEPDETNRVEPIRITVDHIKFSFEKPDYQQQQSQEVIDYKKITKKRDILIALAGDTAYLNNITKVEYFFHRNTFKPMVVEPDKKRKFRVRLNKVWGNFTCEAKLYFRNKPPEIISTYVMAVPGAYNKKKLKITIFPDPAVKGGGG